MSLLSKIFKTPVKPWESEYASLSGEQKAQSRVAERAVEREPELEGFEEEPGFLSRLLGPSMKPWEQEYAPQSVPSKIKEESFEEAGTPDPEPAGKLQRALWAIANENRATPDMFRAKVMVRRFAVGKDGSRKIRKRYQPAASMPEIDGAVNVAIHDVGAKSPAQVDEVVKAALAHLKGKNVDTRILNEKVRAKLA